MPRTRVFLEAYLESRKTVSTVTQKTNLDVENSKKTLVIETSFSRMKIKDFQQNESQDPASAYKIPRAYFESRKQVATVTHLKRQS